MRWRTSEPKLIMIGKKILFSYSFIRTQEKRRENA